MDIRSLAGAWQAGALSRRASLERATALGAGPAAAAFLEGLVIQPNEDYGLQTFVEFAPNPNQALEQRKFNFRMRRA